MGCQSGNFYKFMTTWHSTYAIRDCSQYQSGDNVMNFKSFGLAFVLVALISLSSVGEDDSLQRKLYTNVYLANNQLTTLPAGVTKINYGGGVSLQNTRFSAEEKARITQLMPGTKIYF